MSKSKMYIILLCTYVCTQKRKLSLTTDFVLPSTVAQPLLTFLRACFKYKSTKYVWEKRSKAHRHSVEHGKPFTVF